MESEDEGIPFLKYYNENPGNYLLRNGFELHDTLPGESILTEIGNPGTWQTECPISVNSCPLIGNVNSRICRSDNDKNTLQPTVLKDLNLNNNTKFSKPTPEKEVSSKNSDMVQKVKSSSSEEIQNVFNHISITHQNADSDVQNKYPKSHILSPVDGINYSIKYSLNSSDKQPIYIKPNFEVEEGKGVINKNVIHILSSDMEIDKSAQDNETGQYYLVTTEQYDDCSSPENDPCFWQDFYTILTALKCKVCSFLCERTEEMNEHMNRKHSDLMLLMQKAERENGNITGKKMKSVLNTNQPSDNENILTLFTCSYCTKVFVTKEVLMDHITKVHTETENESQEINCSFKTSSPNTPSKTSMQKLTSAMLKKQKKEMSNARCSVTGCGLKFATNETKATHEECHISDNRQFQCPICKEKFSMWGLCSQHLWTFHDIDAGLYTCTICNKYKSNSPVEVINHMDLHTIVRPFTCNECGKGFNQLSQLRNHSIIHTRHDEFSTSRKCTICERYFANPKSLKKHIQSVHEKSKPYVCNICGHKTSRKAMLELHLRQHTGDKPYHCPHCTYKTGDHNCLRRHLMWHYGSMKYSCPHCKYQSIQSSAFKKHVANRHPEAIVTFKCSICPFTTVNSDSYLTHVKIHEVTQRDENNDEADVNQHLTDHSDHSEEMSEIVN